MEAKSSSKHTQGEWFARSGLTQMCAADATTMCSVGNPADDGSLWWVFSTADTHGDAEADARLISMAPQMYDIVRRLAALQDGLNNGNSSAAHRARRLAGLASALIA